MEKIIRLFHSHSKLFWFLIFVMVFIPLYPKFPLFSIPNTYVAVRAEDVLIAVLSVFWFFKKMPKKGYGIKDFFKETIFQSFLLFWVIGALSLISAVLITQSIFPHLGFLHLARRVEYMMLFIIAATTIKSIEEVKIILKVAIPVTILIVLFGLGQEFLKFPVISTTNREFSKGLILFLSPEARPNSTFAGYYDLAVFLTIILTMLSSLFFNYKSFSAKAIIALTGGLSFILLGMTAARTSFAAILLSLALSFWLNGKKLLVVALFFAAVGIVAIVPDLRHRLVATFTVNILGGGGPKYELPEGVAPPNLNKLSEASKSALFYREVVEYGSNGAKISKVASDVAPGEPLNTTELAVHRSFGIRFDVEWPRALRAFYKNPLLGTGYSSITIATDNDFLRSLGEVGLLGTLGIGLIFFILISQMIKYIKSNSQSLERSFIIGVLCALSCVLLTGIFIDVLEASKIATVLWFLLGVSWAAMRRYENAKDD
jgi:hypothetical protein